MSRTARAVFQTTHVQYSHSIFSIVLSKTLATLVILSFMFSALQEDAEQHPVLVQGLGDDHSCGNICSPLLESQKLHDLPQSCLYSELGLCQSLPNSGSLAEAGSPSAHPSDTHRGAHPRLFTNTFLLFSPGQ